MATYLEIWNLRNSSNLKNRATVAAAKAAQDVLNENPATVNHAKRLLWATEALIHPEQEAERLLWGLVGNATIQTNGEASTDSDIQFAVNGLIDSMSNRF